MQSGRHKSVEANSLYVEPTMNALAHRSKVLQYDPSRDGVQVNGEVINEPTGLSPAKKKKKKKSKHKKYKHGAPLQYMPPMMQHMNFQAMMPGAGIGHGWQQQQQQFYPPYMMGHQGVYGAMGPPGFGMNQGFGGNGNFGMMPQGFGMPLPPAMMPPPMVGAMDPSADSDSSTSSSSSSSSSSSDDSD
jgi:hypothetical protein